jgi:hypothetical protein
MRESGTKGGAMFGHGYSSMLCVLLRSITLNWWGGYCVISYIWYGINFM